MAAHRNPPKGACSCIVILFSLAATRPHCRNCPARAEQSNFSEKLRPQHHPMSHQGEPAATVTRAKSPFKTAARHLARLMSRSPVPIHTNSDESESDTCLASRTAEITAKATQWRAGPSVRGVMKSEAELADLADWNSLKAHQQGVMRVLCARRTL